MLSEIEARDWKLHPPTPKPWKMLEIEGDFPEDGKINKWAMIIGPDGAVIVHRMNKPDARDIVECVNRAYCDS